MARRINPSVTGDYRGRVGPMSLSGWMGIDVMKVRPGKSKRKRTKKQLAQIEVFTRVTTSLQVLRSLFNMSFPQPKKRTQTPFNAAVSELMNTALITHKGQQVVDFTLVKLSKPKELTEQLWNPTVTAGQRRRLNIAWELNPFPKKCTRADDRVKLVYCSVQDGKFIQNHKLVNRNALSFPLDAPAKLIGHEVHVFIVVVSANGKSVSESDYLGLITVLE